MMFIRCRNAVLRTAVLIPGVLLSCVLVLGGCDGGGGSGRSDSGAIALQIDPGTIAPDSLAFLEVQFHASSFDDLNTHGLTIKLLLPDQMRFIGGSASVTTESGAAAVDPIYYGAAPSPVVAKVLDGDGVPTPFDTLASSDFSFLVFSLPPSVLDMHTDGVIRLNLNVSSMPQVARIYADLDRDAETSFDPEHADFDREADLKVDVVQPETSSSDSGST